MSDKNELIIPLRIDAAQALAILKQVGATGKQAGADAGDAVESVGHKATGASKFVGDLTSHFAAMVSAGAAIGAVQKVFTTIAEQAHEGAEYVKKQVEQFSQLRELMRSIDYLKGKTPSTQSAVEMIAKAEATKILTPEEYASGEKAFQQYGSQYIGDTAKKPGEEGAGRVSQATIDSIMPDMLATAKAKDMSPDTAMKTLSTIVKAMPAGTSADKYREIFSGLLNVAQASRGSATATAEAFLTVGSEHVGEGMTFGAGEAGLKAALRTIAVEQESHMGEASTYTNDLAKMLTSLRLDKDKSASLGLKEGMTVEEQVSAIRDTWKASDKSKDFQAFIQPYERGIRGGDTAGRALQTAVVSGLDEGSYSKMAKSMAEATPGTMRKDLDEFLAGGTGQHMAGEAGLKRAKERVGADPFELDWAHRQTEAETQLTDEGRFKPEGYTWGDVNKSARSWIAPLFSLDLGSRNEQLIRQRALANLGQEAVQAGVKLPGNMGIDDANVFESGGTVVAGPTSSTGGRNKAHELLEAIARNTRRADRPLSAPPPDPRTRTP